MISLPSRCNPDLVLAKKAVDDGLLGDLTFGRGRVAHSAGLDRWFNGPSLWFGDAKRAGGGALFDLGCHRVDIIRWLMGEPKSAISKINNFTGNYPIDDNSVSVVEFANKALGVIDVRGRTVRVPTCSNSTERRARLFSITAICTLKRANSRTTTKRSTSPSALNHRLQRCSSGSTAFCATSRCTSRFRMVAT